MLHRCVIVFAISFGFAVPGMGQEKPVELEHLKAIVGVWDAEIEVWPQGPDSPSIKFKGVEKTRASGEYWIVSEFESTAMGQTMTLHSMIGYDLDKKQLVGKQGAGVSRQAVQN